jgi:hypothetical protein
MARNQRNFRFWKYVDDNGFEWSLRGESGGAGAGVDGNAANDLADPVFGRQTLRRHPRFVVAQDPVTFRTIKFVVYTLAAFAAIAGGDVIAVQVAGLATTVNYNVSRKIGEKMPIGSASRNLADA